MPRKLKSFTFTLSETQLADLLELAKTTDRPFEELIREALDQYLAKEKASWTSQHNN